MPEIAPTETACAVKIKCTNQPYIARSPEIAPAETACAVNYQMSEIAPAKTACAAKYQKPEIAHTKKSPNKAGSRIGIIWPS